MEWKVKETVVTTKKRDMLIKNQKDKTCLLIDARGQKSHAKKAENKLKYKIKGTHSSTDALYISLINR